MNDAHEALGISLACIHNSLLTPSLFDGQARPFHVYVGRVGMLAGPKNDGRS